MACFSLRLLSMVVPIFLTSLVSVGWTSQTTTSLVEDAMRFTARKDFHRATQLYERLLDVDPYSGFPLYARFLARTRQTTGIELLLSRPEFSAMPVLVRARTLMALGETTAAIAQLTTATTPQESYAASVALYNLLREAGKNHEANEVLKKALADKNLDSIERLDLFTRYTRQATPSETADIFEQLVTDLLTHRRLDFPAMRQLATDTLASFDGRPSYAEFRRNIAERSTHSAIAAWIHSLQLQRRGDQELARAALEKALEIAHMTTATRAVVLEELAQLVATDTARAETLYRELLPLALNPDRVRLRLAGVLFKAKRYDDACRLIGEIDRTCLDEAEKKLAANMRLTALAKVKPAAEVVKAFEEEARGKSYTYLRELAEAPFALLPETQDHLKYREALQARLRETTAPPELLVLMMSTENQLRSQEAVVAALEAYTQYFPKEYEALNEYALAASQRAYSLVVGPHETTPSAELVSQAVDKAARALWQVIASRPYANQPYLRLIELYRAAGDPSKSRGVALSLLKHTSVTAEQVHLAAYLLDETGYTTDAIAVYRDAIAREPKNGRFKMNLANAFRKLGRYREAMDIYRDLFSHGSYGRQHHVHQLTEDAYDTAEKLGETAELLKFWRALANRDDVPQRDELLMQIGSLLVEKKRYAEGLEFLDIAEKLFPRLTEEIETLRAKAAAMQGDIESAKTIYLNRAKRTVSEEERIEVLLDLGRLFAGAGAFREAIAHWEKVASDFSTHPKAARGLLLAAQAELAQNNKTRARELVSRYLSRDRGDSDGEREAQELLAKLSQ
ncbi:MAG: tetratricopeptide repeat protein [Candidatus Sumerlaeaceae bacterium]|nr:tetratricopeptide repeat protein [Candidatus Sumerlaeaceae bacterium]